MAVASCVIKGNSFSGDTDVATPDGEEEIEDIEVGDEVLAWDEETGRTGVYRVTDTMAHEDPVVVYLELDGEEITTTPEHPFYTRERGWVEAGELRLGEHVRRLDGGYGEVRSVRSVQHQQRMYNLTVETAHTFYVGDGEWLVHNAGCCTASADLARNMEAAGMGSPPAQSAAHHIVAYDDPRAAPARAVLSREGIDVNDAANGVHLPANRKSANNTGHPNAQVHSTVHTNRYYDEVNNRLTSAAPGSVHRELCLIRCELQNGKFPR